MSVGVHSIQDMVEGGGGYGGGINVINHPEKYTPILGSLARNKRKSSPASVSGAAAASCK